MGHRYWGGRLVKYIVVIKERGTDKIHESVPCGNYRNAQNVQQKAYKHFDLTKYYVDIEER